VIKENIARLKARLGDNIVIVAVSKGRSLQEIQEAALAGITDIGENRVQEAREKLADNNCKLPFVKWHMVGHLQTNKVKQAVKIFDLIHSVDSFHLAAEIDKEAKKIDKIQDILIEIKTSPEATKFGVWPDEAVKVIRKISGLQSVRIKGLMTIAPLVDSPEKARPYFRLLKELRDRINESEIRSNGLRILSMGMSSDFEVAIEEGANMLRLGRVIFEG
jgi:pyridoxal phosphate enzyme (YggS family)